MITLRPLGTAKRASILAGTGGSSTLTVTVSTIRTAGTGGASGAGGASGSVTFVGSGITPG